MRNKFEIDKENTLFGVVLNFVLKVLISPIIRIIWLENITGKNNLPKDGSYIIAANHQSFLDFILLYSVFSKKRLHFLAAEKFYDSRFSRALMQYTGQIRVDRYEKKNKEEVIRKGLDVLSSGDVLAIFPQGTRSRSGKIEKTFPGVIKYAMLSGVPVVPVGIRGAYQIWPPHAKKPLIKKHISLHFGNPVEFDKRTGLEWGSLDRNEIIQHKDKLMKIIADLAKKDYVSEN